MFFFSLVSLHYLLEQRPEEMREKEKEKERERERRDAAENDILMGMVEMMGVWQKGAWPSADRSLCSVKWREDDFVELEGKISKLI